MVFSSILFIFIFLPLFLLGHSWVKSTQVRNWVILLFSILFYAWGAPKFVFVILGSTVLDFFIVRSIYRSTILKRKRLFLASSLIMNLGLLAYFKYANFFVENVNAALLGLGMESVTWTSVALPIGISFYTFQTLTYSIDVYRGVHAPLKKVQDYLLYIMSFPQMIAGPIVRYNVIADQIEHRPLISDDFLMGFIRFAIGLAKKVIIANVMAQQADFIFDGDLSQLPTAAAWVGIIAYTFQIYFDFSGYSDMAIGLGRMMGFTFPENFNSPYTSKSITEFWRKWHITLGGFMRDYLYIPLGGNKVGSTFRVYLNLITVFLLSGLWHGASWNFVIWGAFHGIFLILDRVGLAKVLQKCGTFVAVPFTFLVVMIGWVFFRLESFGDAVHYIGTMFQFQGGNFLVYENFKIMVWVAIIFAFFVLVPSGQRIESLVFEHHVYPKRKLILGWLVSMILLALSVALIFSNSFNPFIYFRF